MKKREELECVGRVKGRKITRNWSVRTGCGFVSYGIDIVINNDPEACVFALFASFALFSTQYSSTALQANCRFESTSHSTRYVWCAAFCRSMPIAETVACCCCARWRLNSMIPITILFRRQIKTPIAKFRQQQV